MIDVLGKIDDLLEHAERIEKEAQDIQATKPSGWSDDRLREFRVRYETWYADALAVVPNDLRQTFVKQFEGGRLSQGIRGFISEPARPSVLFGSAAEETRNSLGELFWQYPVSTSFLKPFIQQQSLLRQVRAEAISQISPILGTRNATTIEPGVGGVFISHGRSDVYLSIYRYLRDELHLTVESFETLDHTSQQISGILDQYLGKSVAAVVVMTAEDVMMDGKLRARQNVVHEAGLFQGKLGFDKVAILKASNVEDFTNMSGLIYIQFDPELVNGCFYNLRRFLARHGLAPA